MFKDPAINHPANARADILRSIRASLDESARSVPAKAQLTPLEIESSSIAFASVQKNGDESALIDTFRKQLESVGAQSLQVQTEAELMLALKHILAELESNDMQIRRIAFSDAPLLRGLVRELADDMHEVSIVPGTNDLFGFDIGITSAQAAIAETGTLVLKSERERHRLVSLVPPVHIAIVDAKKIWATLGEAISQIRKDSEMSPAITFITGPSRTADIELTLAIGVHGPKELYVIVNEGLRPTSGDN